jgi:hypothetical protein
MTKLFIFSDNIINEKDTIITIFVHNKKKIISFNIKIKPNGLTQDVNNIVFLLGCIYASPFMATRNTKPRNFQFKLSHRITATHSFLFKCGLKETELCTFSTETKESLILVLIN